MKTQPVVISNITLTKPTQAKTGYGENELSALLADKKFASELHNLTVKIELTQKREVTNTAQVRSGGRRNALYSVAEALKGHDKVSSADRVKRAWINAMNITTLQAEKFVTGGDYGAIKGVVAYLLTEEYNEAEFRNGRIVSSPKRKGKGGNILLSADGKFIFQDTQLVTNVSHADFDGFDYADFVSFENDAKIPFTDEIDVADLPDETKTNDGFFNPEFEQWLTEAYAERNEKVLTKVA